MNSIGADMIQGIRIRSTRTKIWPGMHMHFRNWWPRIVLREEANDGLIRREVERLYTKECAKTSRTDWKI